MPTSYTDFLHHTLYRKYGLDNEYSFESGVFALPLAVDELTLTDADSPVILVKAHAPYRIRNVLFNETKQSGPPMVPSPSDIGAFVFLGGSLYFDSPALDSNLRTSTWTVKGVYSFVENIKYNITDGFVLGTTPFLSANTLDLVSVYGPQTPIGQQNVPTTGAVAWSGTETLMGWAEAETAIDFTNPTGYTYFNTTFYPSQFLNAEMLNGGPVVSANQLIIPQP